MSLLTIIVVFVFVGLVVWLAIKFIPMPPAFAQALPVVAPVLLLLWVFLGLTGTGIFPDIRIGG